MVYLVLVLSLLHEAPAEKHAEYKEQCSGIP